MGQTDRPDDRRVAGSRLPPTANLLSKGITKRLNPESKNARKSRPAPGFLAKSNTCSRQITAINQGVPNTSRTTNLRITLAAACYNFSPHTASNAYCARVESTAPDCKPAEVKLAAKFRARAF